MPRRTRELALITAVWPNGCKAIGESQYAQIHFRIGRRRFSRWFDAFDRSGALPRREGQVHQVPAEGACQTDQVS
jgi:hypothetical protein